MTHYNAKTLGKNVLSQGDRVTFLTPKGPLEYEVYWDHLHVVGGTSIDDNAEVFWRLGIGRGYDGDIPPEREAVRAFASAAYGHTDAGGCWPVAQEGNLMEALTRCVRALFAKAAGKKCPSIRSFLSAKAKADAAKALAEKRAIAAKLRKLRVLPKPARVAVLALNKDRDAFGCQRRHVVALVSALVGADLAPFVEGAA